MSQVAVEQDILGSPTGGVHDLAAGRGALHVDAVLPWAAYANGVLPGEWWRDGKFAAAIAQWRIEGVDRSTDIPETDLRKAVGRAPESWIRENTDSFTAAVKEFTEGALSIRQVRIEAIERDPWRWR